MVHLHCSTNRMPFNIQYKLYDKSLPTLLVGNCTCQYPLPTHLSKFQTKNGDQKKSKIHYEYRIAGLVRSIIVHSVSRLVLNWGFWGGSLTFASRKRSALFGSNIIAPFSRSDCQVILRTIITFIRVVWRQWITESHKVISDFKTLICWH